MAVYAHIEDGAVVNTIVAEPDLLKNAAWLAGRDLVPIEKVHVQAGVGWTRQGGKWNPPPSPVPEISSESSESPKD